MESTGGEGQKCEGLSFDSNVPPDPEAADHDDWQPGLDATDVDVDACVRSQQGGLGLRR